MERDTFRASFRGPSKRRSRATLIGAIMRLDHFATSNAIIIIIIIIDRDTWPTNATPHFDGKSSPVTNTYRTQEKKVEKAKEGGQQ